MIVTWRSFLCPTNKARLYRFETVVPGDWFGALQRINYGTINLPDDQNYDFAAAGASYVTQDGQLVLMGTDAVRVSEASGLNLRMVEFCDVGTPTGMTASQGTYSNMVRLAWNASLGAIDYRILRSGV